ncbi:hypothetical protein [Alkalihalophilus marmarensis]|uniref:hypothetical protein n=1 Tax=Alkalihalophilus marmarensis TaxID=521377 RepID=UPI002DB6088F|nr:hypothetical protein [Alkalihalophilus marmarensis]MEC2070525.1 hypothetical protein [Alkalihalophilus marmarensis]
MQITTLNKSMSFSHETQPFTHHNHSLNQPNNNLRSEIGIWKEGRTSWLREDVWRFAPLYRRAGGIKLLTAYHPKLHLHLTIIERDITNRCAYHRQVFIRNEEANSQQIVLVLHQKPFLGNTKRAMSFYAPESKALVHYSHPHYTTTFVKGMKASAVEYAVGGIDSVWQEDNGHTIVRPLCAESHESVMAVKLNLSSHEETRVDQWMDVSRSMVGSETFINDFLQ